LQHKFVDSIALSFLFIIELAFQIQLKFIKQFVAILFLSREFADGNIVIVFELSVGLDVGFNLLIFHV